MTKTGLLAARAGGYNVADLDHLVRDDHPVDQQPDQLAALRRLREVEDENRRLKQLVADLTLDKQMVQEVLRKNW